MSVLRFPGAEQRRQPPRAPRPRTPAPETVTLWWVSDEDGKHVVRALEVKRTPVMYRVPHAPGVKIRRHPRLSPGAMVRQDDVARWGIATTQLEAVRLYRLEQNRLAIAAQARAIACTEAVLWARRLEGDILDQDQEVGDHGDGPDGDD